MRLTVEVQTPRAFIQEVEASLSSNLYSVFGRILLESSEGVERLSSDEWADKYRVMGQSSRYRKWATARTPYLKEISQFLSDDDPAHQVVVLSKAAQMGGSEVALNEVLRRLHIEPCTILYYMEAGHKVDQWAADRLDPAFSRPPFTDRRIHSSGNRRSYSGGALILNGIGSPASLSSVTARLVVGDEVARYPITIAGEGDFLSLAKGRISTFGTAGKIFLVSTPRDSITGEGTFEDYVGNGDMREYLCPCVKCGVEYLWTIDTLRKIDGEAVMVCPSCGGYTRDGHEKTDAILAGGWAPSQEPKMAGCVSYRLSGLVAPADWKPWGKILSEYKDAMEGRVALKTFYNLTLGLPFDEPEARVPPVDAVEKKMKRDFYRSGVLPDGVSVLTMAIDVQKDFMVCEVKGWGNLLENWSIEYFKMDCVISDLPSCVNQVNAIMKKRFYNADRSKWMTVKLGCIDSGYMAHSVYELAARFPQPLRYTARPSIYIPHGCLTPTKGATMLLTDRLIMAEPGGKTSKGLRRKMLFWRLGTDNAKRELYRSLHEDVDALGVVARPHAPADYKSDYFQELVAEQIETVTNERTGRQEQRFKLPPRRANEALDCHVMNRAAIDILGGTEWDGKQWSRMRAKLVRTVKKDAAAKKTRNQVRAERKGRLKERRESVRARRRGK